MKRIISILICLVLFLTTACGCAGNTPNNNSSDIGTVNSEDNVSSNSNNDITSSEDISSESEETTEEEIEYIYVDEDEIAEKISVPVTTSKLFTTLPAEYTSLLRNNPDRGFRSEESWEPSGDINELKNITYESILEQVRKEVNENTYLENVTISRVYFQMKYYRDVLVLPDEVINYFDMVLRAYKEHGIKVYNCIVYQRGLDYGDYGASKEVILSHIEQYAKLWEKHKDTIYAYDMTLIGSYGEWTAIKPALTDADKKEIVDKVLENLPESIYFVMRMPIYKKNNISIDHPRYKTTGFAADAFFGKMFPYDDYGQADWRPADDNEWWQMSIKESPYGVMDGELFTTRYFRDMAMYVDGYTSIEGFSELHMNTFSIYHGYADMATYGGTIDETVMYGWKGEEVTPEKLKELGVLVTPTYFTDTDGKTVKRNCFEYIRDYLGYRFSATDLAITGGTKKGESIKISMNLKNYGFSSAFNLKSGFAILDEENNVISEIEVGDPTAWHNTDPDNYDDRTQLVHNLTAQMKLPEKKGTYKVAFFLRNNLGQTARLDNTVEYSNGFNILHMFTLD